MSATASDDADASTPPAVLAGSRVTAAQSRLLYVPQQLRQAALTPTTKPNSTG